MASDIMASGAQPASVVKVWWVVHILGTRAIWTHEAYIYGRRAFEAHVYSWDPIWF